jgi:hypothetical protein
MVMVMEEIVLIDCFDTIFISLVLETEIFELFRKT